VTDQLLCIVPARGGSVGIPRKNTRVLDGRPLVLAKLEALAAADVGPVVCSTDDPVIASIARMAGYQVHERSEGAAKPEATIAEVVTEVVHDLDWTGPVGVFQPTSPGLGAKRVRSEVGLFLLDDSLRTACSVTAAHGVSWTPDGQQIGQRVNRQAAGPSQYPETGGIRLVKDPAILPEMVDLDGHHLIELGGAEAIDVDDHAQLAGVRQAINATTVTFVAAVGHEIGTGHLRRCLTLADELAHHDVRFLLATDDPETWFGHVTGAGYRMGEGILPGGIAVLDMLGADPAFVWSLRQQGTRVVVLEDGGVGAQAADLAINELLDVGDRFGPAFAVIRPEFLTGRRHEPTHESTDRPRVLVSFGGTDPTDTADRVARALLNIGLHVTRRNPADEARRPIAEDMATHHLLVSSCGRTLHEAAAIGIPTIGIPVNGAEEAHLRLPSVRYLPRVELVTDAEVTAAVRSVLAAPGLRVEMSEHGQSLVDGRGTQRIARMIDDLAEGIR
jgi:spore coat polysaccharide biosynthesis predicted glycosyltransferase SpsG/CMP-N-acetylneuraminic acid synthetase